MKPWRWKFDEIKLKLHLVLPLFRLPYPHTPCNKHLVNGDLILSFHLLIFLFFSFVSSQAWYLMTLSRQQLLIFTLAIWQIYLFSSLLIILTIWLFYLLLFLFIYLDNLTDLFMFNIIVYYFPWELLWEFGKFFVFKFLYLLFPWQFNKYF